MEKKKLLYLSREMLLAVGMTYSETVECVTKSFQCRGEGTSEMPPKLGVHPRDSAFMHAMPAHLKGSLDLTGLKWVGGFPSNPAQGLPFLHGLVILNDSATGIPLAIMDASYHLSQSFNLP